MAILLFWGGAILRTCSIYALGYLAASGGNRFARIKALLSTPLYRSAQDYVNRWGVLAVPACFLTVGFQSAVILTTGFTKMRLRLWIPAMLVGTFIWGLIYATVGMAVIWAWLEDPWVALALVLLIIICAVLVRRLSRARRAPAQQKEGRSS